MREPRERRVIQAPGRDQQHVVEVVPVAEGEEEDEVVGDEDEEDAVVEAVGEGLAAALRVEGGVRTTR